MRVPIAAATLCWACFAQSGQPAFEVASVKRLASDSGEPGSNLMRGGPGTSDPGRITFSSVTLKRLLMAAYGIEVDQVSGPGWLDVERYSVAANVPSGTNKEQLKRMLQNLVMERFQMVVHHETKNSIGYELMVAKRGAGVAFGNGHPPPKGEGFPDPVPGRYAANRTENGITRLTFNQFSMPALAGVLGMPLGGLAGNRVAAAMVIDKTGLAEKYDFTLEFAGYMGPGGAFPSATPDVPAVNAPDLFSALEVQLGLRLVEKKVPHDVLVIDSINKAPTEN